MSIKLLQLAIFSLPINSLAGPSVFGFLGSELAFYVLLILIIVNTAESIAGTGTRTYIPLPVKALAALSILSIISSFVLNIDTISASELKGRSGIHKHFNSILVYVFGLLVMLTTHRIATSRNFRAQYLFKPILYGTSLVLVVATIEFFAWYSPSALKIYEFILGVFGTGNFGFIHGRLSSITREPSVLGMYLCFTLIWLVGFRNSAHFKNIKITLTLYILASLIIVWLAEARTGLAIIFVMCIGWLFVKRLSYIHTRVVEKSLMLFFAIGLVVSNILLMAYDGISVDFLVSRVLDADNMSNISRYSTAIAASSVFLEHPLFGTGFGQFAFSGIDHIPNWGWQSYDIRAMFLDHDSPWPQIYSTPARIGAEQGLVGIVIYYGCLFWLLMQLLNAVATERARLQGQSPVLGIILVFGVIYVIAGGLMQGSFRHFGMWIMLGFASAYCSTRNPEFKFFSRSR